VAAVAIAVLITVTCAALYVGAAVIARHRAQAAADLASLAAAGRMPAGAGAACVTASHIATAMDTALTDCTVHGLDVLVTVDARVALGAWRVGPARAVARAGPADQSRVD
jgi:secretion/DNA translocation related TadE-like protein